MGPKFMEPDPDTNGCRARKLPVAPALLIRRVIAQKLPFGAQSRSRHQVPTLVEPPEGAAGLFLGIRQIKVLARPTSRNPCGKTALAN